MRLNPFRRGKRRGRPRGSLSDGWLKPATKRAVLGVILLVLAILAGFSFFGQAGRVGDVLLSLLKRIFGLLAYVSPLLFGYIAWRLLRPSLAPLPRWRIVGLALLIVGLLGTFHLIGVAPDDALQVAAEGKGGGYLGFTLSYPLSLATSPIISLLIFIAALIIGIFMTFNISPAQAWQWLRDLKPVRADDGVDGVENEDEQPSKAPVRGFRIRAMKSPEPPDPKQLALDEERLTREKQQLDLRRKQVRAANKKYVPPPVELLASSTRQPQGGNVKENEEIIRSTLEKFHIGVTMDRSKVGPTVTQYTLRPAEGVRLAQITALQNDLARALQAHPLRIEAPIPNTDLVGIEIPNKEVALVRLRDLLTSKRMKQAESPLSIALGKDVSGETVTAELERMPHLLLAGATNSGKSVSIHSILMSLLYRNSPALLRLILIDPKRVELTAYNGIPHLWGNPVITDTSKALNALKWALREMDKRYQRLEASGSRNLFSYNVNYPEEAMPFIVIVIDELADLMAKHSREVEGPVVRLSQLARAVGIHLIVATQRPSVNVITGLIKANIPARIAFKVASQIDSRTILDMGGAEKLVGTGDMLFLASDNSKPQRLQGGFVSEDEVREVVKFIVANNDVVKQEIESAIVIDESVSIGGSRSGEKDSLFEEAKRIARESGKLSASLLQRRLSVGYSRAARILDMLEGAGIIGPQEGNKPREILMTAAEEEELKQDQAENMTEAEASLPELELPEDSTTDNTERSW